MQGVKPVLSCNGCGWKHFDRSKNQYLLAVDVGGNILIVQVKSHFISFWYGICTVILMYNMGKYFGNSANKFQAIIRATMMERLYENNKMKCHLFVLAVILNIEL